MNILNLFNPKNNESVGNNVTAKDIHNEIYSARDILFAEAERISAELINDELKEETAKKLYAMGFSKTANISAPVRALDLRQWIKYYDFYYPNNKFINEDSVKILCNKYNMYLCEVRDFTASIPLKNQLEITAFRVREMDLNNQYYRIRHPYYNEKLAVDPTYRQEYKEKHEAYEAQLAQMEKSEAPIPAFDLKIIAPESQIDMSDKRKLGHQIVQDDPMVLQPVKAGYLVVTAWGDEASDEIVVNQKMN